MEEREREREIRQNTRRVGGMGDVRDALLWETKGVTLLEGSQALISSY
jgi:hypothetical protein